MRSYKASQSIPCRRAASKQVNSTSWDVYLFVAFAFIYVIDSLQEEGLSSVVLGATFYKEFLPMNLHEVVVGRERRAPECDPKGTHLATPFYINNPSLSLLSTSRDQGNLVN